MNAKELKRWNELVVRQVQQHISMIMPPPAAGSTAEQEIDRWLQAALARQGLRSAAEWGASAEELRVRLHDHLDVLLGYAKASDHPVDTTDPEGEEKVSDPENVPTESAVPESFPFPESPVVVYPSNQPGIVYELPDGTAINFSVTLRLGGTAEMALELIGQFVALFDQYGLKPSHGVVIGKTAAQQPQPPAQPARPANVPPVPPQAAPPKPAGGPFAVAQPASPGNEADSKGHVPGEMKVHLIEFVTFNDANGKKNIELWIKNLQWPIRIERTDQMTQIVNVLQGGSGIEFPPQLGAKYPVQARLNRIVGDKRDRNNNFYLNFHSIELGAASGSPSDLPF